MTGDALIAPRSLVLIYRDVRGVGLGRAQRGARQVGGLLATADIDGAISAFVAFFRRWSAAGGEPRAPAALVSLVMSKEQTLEG